MKFSQTAGRKGIWVGLVGININRRSRAIGYDRLWVSTGGSRKIVTAIADKTRHSAPIIVGGNQPSVRPVLSEGQRLRRVVRAQRHRAHEQRHRREQRAPMALGASRRRKETGAARSGEQREPGVTEDRVHSLMASRASSMETVLQRNSYDKFWTDLKIVGGQHR